MNSIQALRLDRDRDLSGDIVPEAYFRCVAVRELNYPWPEHSFERQLTEVRAAWTDRFLYLHLWAKDSWVVGRETKPKGRVSDDDCLIVTLMNEKGDCWGWEFNPLGTLNEYRFPNAGNSPPEASQFDRKWRSALQFKVRRHDAGWVAEMRIPWVKDLGRVPIRGESWKASFHRIDVDRRGRSSLSTFSDLAPESPVSFYQPSRYGEIFFG